MKVHKIRLIDNSYDLEIANQLLKRFIETKIAFLQDRIKEAAANDQEVINQLALRIKDLEAETRSLDLFFEEYEGENVEMEIGSTIVMSINHLETK